MRHPLDTTPDDAPLEEIVATGGLSDISRYEHAAELQRLKDAVVEAAKAKWRGYTHSPLSEEAENETFDKAVDALIQFESKEG